MQPWGEQPAAPAAANDGLLGALLVLWMISPWLYLISTRMVIIGGCDNC
jgi:hypothetical protein